MEEGDGRLHVTRIGEGEELVGRFHRSDAVLVDNAPEPADAYEREFRVGPLVEDDDPLPDELVKQWTGRAKGRRAPHFVFGIMAPPRWRNSHVSSQTKQGVDGATGNRVPAGLFEVRI